MQLTLRPIVAPIALFALVSSGLLTSPATAADQETQRTVRTVLQPTVAETPVPDRAMSYVDLRTRELIRARWEKLEKTINRTHRHDPLATDVPPEQIRPWAPASESTQQRGPDPIQLEVNGQPDSVAPAGFSSTVNEPSVASAGSRVFYTANWFAAASNDGGASWTYVNPYTGPFPEPANENFCCDQQAHYDSASNSMFWLQQLIPTTGSANGTQRINVDQGADGTWDCMYDVTPQQAGFANGTFPDYPDLAVSDQHLFVTSNIFPSGGGGFVGAFVGRLSLADMTSCSPTTTDFYTDTGFGSFRMTQGAGGTMYFADHQTASSIRVWSWPQANNSPTSVLRTINAFLTGNRVCPGPDARDWCGFIDSRILGGAIAGNRVAFFWTPQQNPGGGFPFPYSQGVILDAANSLSVLEQPVIWSADRAWVYPSIASNSNGDFGGTILWGGGLFFPSCSAWLADDANGDTFAPLDHEPVITGTSGPNSNRSGDYLSTRTYSPNDAVYGGSCFGYLSTTAGSTRYVLFGRQSNFATSFFADGFESGNTAAWDATVAL